MNKKQLTLPILLSPLIFSLLIPVYASWTEYKNVRYMDLDGDLTDEIIIEAKHGAGSNHYLEDMRIFKDKYPELELIFFIRTLDSTYGFESSLHYNCDEISEVHFTEPNLENGERDIIIKTKKIYYKDQNNKIVDKEEDLRTKIFKWNGQSFVEGRQEIERDTNSRYSKEREAQSKFDTIIETLADAEREDRKVDLEKWVNSKRIKEFSRTALSDSYVKNLYKNFKSTVVNPPKPGTYTEYSIKDAEDSLVKVEKLGCEVHNLFLALSDKDFAKYGRLIGTVRDVLYIDWKHIPYAIKHNNGRDIYWYELHNMGLTEAEKEYFKIFHISN